MDFILRHAWTQEDRVEFRTKWEQIRQGLLLLYAQRLCTCVTPEKLKQMDPELRDTLHDLALVCDCAHLSWWESESVQGAVADLEKQHGV